jgi:hypothetical protein
MSTVLQQLRNDPAMEQAYREAVAVAGCMRAPRRRRTHSTIRAGAVAATATAARATRRG